MEAIGDKWSLLALYALCDGPVRFNALERRLAGVSQKVLSGTLRGLEQSGLVERRVFAEVPPRVEYRLTEFGRTLLPLMDAICAWSRRHGGHLRQQDDGSG
jgi:DNA-binding HxlR family transcriptional regulator